MEQDLEEAAKWYQQALDAGYEPDETDLEHLIAVYEEKPESMVFESFAEVLNEAGKKAVAEGEYDKSYEYFTMEADMGYVKGVANLGVLYGKERSWHQLCKRTVRTVLE